MFDVIVRHEAERSVATLVVADPDSLARAAEVLAPMPANGGAPNGRGLRAWMRLAKQARRSQGRKAVWCATAKILV
jgi:Mg-chelatase subunit ChlD